LFRLSKKRSKSNKERLDEIHKSYNQKKNKNDFDSIMRFAQSVLDRTSDLEGNKDSRDESKEHPLVDVVRLVGRQLQTKYITNLLYEKYESNLPSLDPEIILFNPSTDMTLDGISFEDIQIEIGQRKKISLNRDLVLPWPWKTSRIVNCFAQIGEGRRNGSWRQDFNHNVELWLPMGIGWVHGGNHSISVGIIQGEGNIIPSSVYDISKVYDYVGCDGINYFRKEDGFVISPVKNAEFAAIFEIGRMMKKNSISY